jgi:competence protein ComK
MKKHKEMNVWEDYEVSNTTMALTSHKHPTYQTKIYDVDGIFYCSKSMMDLIDEGCLRGGSTYTGRKKAITFVKRFIQCTPIPVSPNEGIFAFPTCSPSAWECTWLFYFHIKELTLSGTKQTIVTFHNGMELTLDFSKCTLENQMQKTESCIVQFSPQFSSIRNRPYKMP